MCRKINIQDKLDGSCDCEKFCAPGRYLWKSSVRLKSGKISWEWDWSIWAYAAVVMSTSEIWTWCTLTTDWWEALFLCLLPLDKKIAGPQPACSDCAHIVRVACICSMAIYQGFLNTWWPHRGSCASWPENKEKGTKYLKGKKRVCVGRNPQKFGDYFLTAG